MKEALTLLCGLDEADVDWILETGKECEVPAETVIIEIGSHPANLYFVLKGLVGLYDPAFDNKYIASMGPGELLGEMSFIRESTAIATVKAIEPTLLLALPGELLNRKHSEDPAFAARLYRAFSKIIADRLNWRVNLIKRVSGHDADDAQPSSVVWSLLQKDVEHFKNLVSEADKAAIKNHGNVPDQQADKVKGYFNTFARSINEQIGEDSPTTDHVRRKLGVLVQREILPYMLLTQTGERFYSKPRGYAGDYLTLENIYKDKAEGVGRLGALLDRCFLELSATRAVKDRRHLMAREIKKMTVQNETLKLTCMASGPATEVFDVFDTLDKPSKLKCTLIDIDYQALGFVSDKAQEKGLRKQVTPVNGNLVYLALGRQKIELQPQDLIYSIGLIDYLADKFVVKLLNFVYGHLTPGGKVILGNFHPRNPDRAFMNHIFNWQLIHRTEADMDRLYEQSDFGRPCTNIQFEKEGIDMFAECIKE
ncbi:MAG: cyclic nucleotide-binding domain-containing protein [bacterium]|nr:cyclic nucleotide-binding domain-containing protein [bacterium]